MGDRTDIQVDIVLATYNGAKFIREQLQSLLSQTYENWRLLVRDDGSTDNTLEIIREFQGMYVNKIILIEDQDRNLGPSRNFARLLEYTSADYIMFCDQDDVWQKDKVKVTLDKMLEMESKYTNRVPILVHTDLEIVNQQLETISTSMFKYQKLNSGYKQLNQLLVQNNVTGCTTMINRLLKEMATPIPQRAIMHDWWLALVASAFGRIGFIDVPTIRYRQHSNNDVGAKKFSLSFVIDRIRDRKLLMSTLSRNFQQAWSFYEQFAAKLSSRDQLMVQAYSSIPAKNAIRKIQTILANGFAKQGMIRNIGFMLAVIPLKINPKDRSKK